MKISVVTWDASFREKFHAIKAFGEQNYSINDFEFLWCDFYKAENEVLLAQISNYQNARVINLENAPNTKWHLGKTLNRGIIESTGDIIVIPDGDIIVDENFLQVVENEFKGDNDKVVYFRRWDEPKDKSCNKSYDIKYLEKHTKLVNLTNYGGCFAIRRETFKKIGFYEEHEVFSGPGANGKEQYLRFRNKGLAIKWSNKKIFHPYHENTGTSDKISDQIIKASKYHNWINPYQGLNQSWVLKNRDKHLHWKANDGSIHEYLKNIPKLESLLPKDEKKNILKRFFKI